METAKPSSNHSYKPSIIGQMIMLPSHGQSTAAVEQINVTGQVRLLIVRNQGAMFLLYRRGLNLPSSFIKFSPESLFSP